MTTWIQIKQIGKYKMVATHLALLWLSRDLLWPLREPALPAVIYISRLSWCWRSHTL